MDWFLLFPMASGVVCALCALSILHRDSVHESNRVAAALIIGCAWWAFCQVLWLHAQDPALSMTFHRLGGLGWAFLGPLSLHLVSSATHRPPAIVRVLVPPMYGVAALFALCQLFTPWMHVEALPTSFGWNHRAGPLFPVFFVFTMLCSVPAIIIATRGIQSAPSPAERNQLRMIAIGMGSPLICASITSGILHILEIPSPRLGAVSFSVLAGVMVWSNQRYGFSALAPGSFWREIGSMLPDGVAFVGLDGEVRTSNLGLARLLRIEPGATDAFPLAKHLTIDLGRQGSSFKGRECELIRPNDERLPVLLSSTLAHDKVGEAIGWIVVIRDLREVADLRSHLVTSGRLAAVGELAAGIAHEINNPISYVRSNLGQLRERWAELGKRFEGDAPDPALDAILAEGDELIDESLDGIERTAAIVQDVKGFAHRGSGARERVELNALLDNVLRVARPSLKYRVDVRRDFSEISPIWGASQELKQLFLNLVMNASQALEGPGAVEIRTREESGRVCVTVSDDGCGIAPEDIERVFDPFFTTKPVGEGTGLGLAISYQIARRHGADLRFEPRSGGGTVFFVTFPLDPRTDA